MVLRGEGAVQGGARDQCSFTPAPRRPPHRVARVLRSHRARGSPADVGMPDGGRRRTPGLRREEAAVLAGVGVSWYTWLEQGGDIKVSEQVLDAIARVLLLDAWSPRPGSIRDRHWNFTAVNDAALVL
ncbi:helix-turn-helix domain-containing protein [Streptomyces sp. 205]|uniref:Helix-turn-helix domain-containing protein n=1 Tax=Streptomyces coffeae TaxID=621382 RepID=A0ABS1NMB8_9ACTN|nr:helix-turn-helix domain-containing protein [Streptomyces coffeae]